MLVLRPDRLLIILEASIGQYPASVEAVLGRVYPTARQVQSKKRVRFCSVTASVVNPSFGGRPVQVDKNTVPTIEYAVSFANGELLESSKGDEPLDYLHGSGNLVPGLEAALEGKTVGDQVKTAVPPELAYGERDDSLRRTVARSELDSLGTVEEGMRFEAETANGTEVLNVISVDGDQVVVDANHPLAGETLHFEVEIVGLRAATEEEITHGHVHAPGGHHHH